MEIEHSNNTGYQGYAYLLDKKEKAAISEALKPYVKKLQKKIERLENSPKNEGQISFLSRINDLEIDKKNIECIIKEFSKGS